MARNRQDRSHNDVSNPPHSEGTMTNPRPQDIAERAYELYQRRGGEHGRDWDDWFAAERELQQQSTRETE